jgi:hypothetical protein
MRFALVLVVLALSAACTHVAPHERGRLAHPTMSPSDGRSLAREHVHAVQEGASGGEIGASSGCGCN